MTGEERTQPASMAGKVTTPNVITSRPEDHDDDLRLVSGKWHETSGRLFCTSCRSTKFDLTRYSTGLLVLCARCGDTAATDRAETR